MKRHLILSLIALVFLIASCGTDENAIRITITYNVLLLDNPIDANPVQGETLIVGSEKRNDSGATVESEEENKTTDSQGRISYTGSHSLKPGEYAYYVVVLTGCQDQYCNDFEIVSYEGAFEDAAGSSTYTGVVPESGDPDIIYMNP